MSEDRIQGLFNELRNDNWQVRLEAAKSLGKFGAVSVPALVKALSEDDERQVRMEAIESLGKIGSEAREALSALAKALAEEDKDMRLEITKTLGKLGVDAVPALIKTLNDVLYIHIR